MLHLCGMLHQRAAPLCNSMLMHSGCGCWMKYTLRHIELETNFILFLKYFTAELEATGNGIVTDSSFFFFFFKKKNHSSLKENVIETPQENSARFFFLNAASWHAATLELASDSLQLHGTRSGNRFKLQYNASTICWKREKQRDVQHGNGQLHREVLLRFAEQKCNATSVRIRLADTN